MNKALRTLALALTFLIGFAITFPFAQATTITLIENGGEPNDNMPEFLPMFSGDGNFIYFDTNATNLIAGDTNNQEDVFSYATATAAFALIDRSSTSTQVYGGGSQTPDASLTGRYVAFESWGSGLVQGDPTNIAGRFHVYRRDTSIASTTRIDRTSTGAVPNFDSLDSNITSDGRYVVYTSGATNVATTPALDGNAFHVVRYDTQTRTAVTVDVLADGTTLADADAYGVVISDDGRYVAFVSNASNLDPSDNSFNQKVFLKDLTTGALERIDVASDGTSADLSAIVNNTLSMTTDARYVVFASNADNLVPGDTNGGGDIFVRDRQAGTTELVSDATDGTLGDNGGVSGTAFITDDGRYVVFESGSTNLVAGDTNASNDVFVHDRLTDQTMRVDLAYNDAEADFGASFPNITRDGKVIVYASQSTNLVAGGTSGNKLLMYYSPNPLYGATLDTTPPAVSVTAPADGSTVSGASVSLSATASDDTAVTGVQFKLDGAPIGSEDLSSPYGITWDSTAATNASHTLVAVARDGAGNYATSSAVTITVDNAGPVSSSIASGSPTRTAATITWTTDENASSQVAYGPTASYATYTAVTDTSPRVTSHSVGLSGLTCGTTTHYAVVSTDAYGNTSTSTDSTFTTATCATAPSVSTSAASGIAATSATLNGSISSLGTASPTVRGFAYGLTTSYGATTTENGSFSTGAFSASASSLTCSTVYHVRTYATSADGTGYGSDATFTTSGCSSPSVSTSAASGVTDTGATLNGSISSNGSATPTVRGFVYGETIAYGATTTESGSFSPGSYSAAVSGLTCGTTYHYSAYSTSADGTGFSSDGTFATNACATSASSGGGSRSGSGIIQFFAPFLPFLVPAPLPEASPSPASVSAGSPSSGRGTAHASAPLAASQPIPAAPAMRAGTSGNGGGAAGARTATGTRTFGISVLRTVSSLLAKTFDAGVEGTHAIGSFVPIAGIAVSGLGLLWALASNLRQLGDIPTMLYRALTLFPFGYLRRRDRAWGTVYDSKTRRPLDPAVVTLYDAAGKELKNAITDLDGRYAFLVDAGTYSIVAQKGHHSFPAKDVPLVDPLYPSPYTGGPFIVGEEGVILKDIPLDPVDFDWNESEKYRRGLYRFFSRFDRPLAYAALILTPLGAAWSLYVAIAAPSVLNTVFVLLYAAIGLLYLAGLGPRLYGALRDGQGNPLPFAVVKAFRPGESATNIHAVADHMGRYYLLLPPDDTFDIEVAVPAGEAAYTPVLRRRYSGLRGHFNRLIRTP